MAVLLILVITIVAVACNTEPNDSTDGTNPQTQSKTDTDAVTEERTGYLEGIHYDGYEYRILSSEDEKHFVFCDEENSSAMPTAVYKANSEVEDVYGISITTIPLVDNRDMDTVRALTLSDVDTYDATHMHDCSTATLSLEGFFMDIYDVPNMDPSAPWWPQFSVESLTLNDRMYFIHNFSSYHPAQSTVMMAFNKDIIKRFNMENPYDLVRSGDWTMDKLIEMSTTAYEDDGNGRVDENDVLGIATGGVLYCWTESFGFEFYEKVSSDSAEIEFNGNDEKLIEFLEKFYEWTCTRKNGVLVQMGADSMKGLEIFAKGNTLFTARDLGNMITYILATDIDYGFLPMPKYDETQKDYVGACTGNPMAIPNNLTDYERAGAIAEAMSYAGYKYLKPAYVDVALKNRYSDDDSREMIDLAFNNRIISFTYLYSNVGTGIQWRILYDTIGANKNNFVSYINKNANGEIPTIEKIMEFYSK